MPGPIKIDKGLEAMEATLTMGGHTATLIRTFGTTDVAGVPLRLVGAYQADDGSPPQSVEIYLGGRFTEIDLGKSKAGDDTEHKYTLPLSTTAVLSTGSMRSRSTCSRACSASAASIAMPRSWPF
jgi:P2 family phage contractile tail tube protein